MLQQTYRVPCEAAPGGGPWRSPQGVQSADRALQGRGEGLHGVRRYDAVGQGQDFQVLLQSQRHAEVLPPAEAPVGAFRSVGEGGTQASALEVTLEKRGQSTPRGRAPPSLPSQTPS